MNQNFKIAFANEKLELEWFELNHASIKPYTPDSTDENSDTSLVKNNSECEKILILPAAAGLPFKVKLAFNDAEKLRKVIPQFVADQYVDVNESWLFSYKIAEVKKDVCENNASDQQPDKQKLYEIQGVALPPEFSPQKIMPDMNWRIAILDAYLVDSETATAFHINTPVSSFVAIFSGKDLISRIIKDFSLPVMPVLAAEGVKEINETKLVAYPEMLYKSILHLLDDDNELDLSGWRRLRRGHNRKVTALAFSLAILGLIFVGHFFLWFETRLTEKAADRTVEYINQSFSAVFPGVPVVDAVSQISRQISLAEDSLAEAGSVPNLDWIPILKVAASGNASNVVLQNLKARPDSVRFQGRASTYAALEKFNKAVTSQNAFAEVRIAESRRNQEQVLFTLEAKWKK